MGGRAMIYWQCSYYVFVPTAVFITVLIFTLVKKLFDLIDENERLKRQLADNRQGGIEGK